MMHYEEDYLVWALCVMGRKPVDIIFDFTTKPSEVNAYILKNFLKVH